MKILVTGAAGLIGSHLCDILVNKGHKVTGIDNLSFGNIDNINKNINFIKDKVQNIFQYTDKYDIIYHLAAQSYGKGAFLEPEKDVEWNAKGTLNICRLAQLKNVKKMLYFLNGL